MRLRYLFTLLLLVPSFGFSQPLSLWSEFVPYAVVASHLPTLTRLEVGLIVAVREDTLERPGFSLHEFCALKRAADATGVDVRPWLLLSEADEYWFNKSNHAAARSFALSFVDSFRSACPGIALEWVTFDMESPKRLSLRLMARDRSGDSLRDAVTGYSELVRELHARGVKVHAVTSHFVLNEGARDPYKIQDAKSIPFRGIPWDEATFMLYKAEFEDKVGLDYSSGLTYAYARRAVRRYGKRFPVGFDLGEVGKVLYPVPFQGLRHPWELYFDMAAVRAAGASRINVYSMDGLLSGNPDDASEELRRFLRPTPAEIRHFKRRHGRESHRRVNLPSWATLRALDLLFATFPRSRVPK